MKAKQTAKERALGNLKVKYSNQIAENTRYWRMLMVDSIISEGFKNIDHWLSAHAGAQQRIQDEYAEAEKKLNGRGV